MSKTLFVVVTLLGSVDLGRAAPGGLVQRDEAGGMPLLFNKGGPQLSDIATVVPDDSERLQEPAEGEHQKQEKASIFAQVLIATRKLNKDWLISMFFEYDGETEVASDTAMTVLFDNIDISQSHQSDAKHNPAVDIAKNVDGLAFGLKADHPWWPYALFAGAVDAGWRWDLEGYDLAKQTFEILTGKPAQRYDVKAGGDKQDYLLPMLAKADFSPLLLQLAPFDRSKESLKNARWESWVTVMSFNQDSKSKLKYATSYIKFSEDNGDISQEVEWNDIKVISAVFLDQSASFDGRPAGTGSSSEGIAPTKPA